MDLFIKWIGSIGSVYIETVERGTKAANFHNFPLNCYQQFSQWNTWLKLQLLVVSETVHLPRRTMWTICPCTLLSIFYTGIFVGAAVLSAIVFVVLILRQIIRKSKGKRLASSSQQCVGVFHPYCNAGGGGERVLWCAIRALQKKWVKDFVCDHLITTIYLHLDTKALEFVCTPVTQMQHQSKSSPSVVTTSTFTSIQSDSSLCFWISGSGWKPKSIRY